jgi:hypothetical protein
MRGAAVLLAAACTVACTVALPAAAAVGDPRAIALAESTLAAMGGPEAWEATRFLRWRFRDRRLHHWDRWTGDVRIEAGERVVCMNVGTHAGRAWESGREITEPDSLGAALELGHAWWVNDSYWLIMPAKLLDPGVVLADLGSGELADGRPADRLGVTFDPGTGLTPENRYEVWIARDTGLVEQWAYFPKAADTEPRFTQPWGGWKRCGSVLIATEHGGDPWDVSAPDSLPRALFEAP